MIINKILLHHNQINSILLQIAVGIIIYGFVTFVVMDCYNLHIIIIYIQ